MNKTSQELKPWEARLGLLVQQLHRSQIQEHFLDTFLLVCWQNGGVFVVPNESKVTGTNVRGGPDNLYLPRCYHVTTQIWVLPILCCMGHDFVVPPFTSQVPKSNP